MPKRLSLQPHLALDELERRYRTAKESVARSHWQTVWLRAQGLPSERVAAVTGYTANWVRAIAQRYHQHGPAGLGDRRHRNPGATGLLSPAQQAELAQALKPATPRWRPLDRAQSGGLDGHHPPTPYPSATGMGVVAPSRLDA